MIDYKKLFQSYEKDFLKDLENLIKIPSVLDESMLGNKEHPFGKGPKEALLYMESLAKRDGFESKIYDNMVLEITYGKSSDFILAAGHLDVVPFGDGWDTPPTKLIYDKTRDALIGRGTLDDKGASLATYYALKIIKEKNIEIGRKIKLILGSDEESGSRCVKRYNELVKETPKYGFIPDSDFPLVFSEKGILRLKITGYDEKLKSSTECSPANMVPNKVSLTLKNPHNGKETFTGTGLNAHGSIPETGKNAVIDLVRNLKKEGFSSLLIDTIDKYFNKNGKDDTKGILLGIDAKDKEMGNLTQNLGYFKVSNGNFEIVLDIRYPKTITSLKIKETVSKKLGKDFTITISSDTPRLYISPKSNLVKTLSGIYQKQTGDKKTKIIATGGGTYAREFKNTVAFGPGFPNRISLMHAPNEFILKKDLMLAGSIYLEALIKLSHLK